MINKIEKFIREEELIKEGEGVVLGLSGGADSVCLLFVLKAIFGEKIKLLAVHINHGIRGEESERDEAFVLDLCQKQGVELLVKRIDVAKKARRNKLSPEEAGRICRYEEFHRILEERRYHKIAVAHNLQDVAETFFFHLARGSAITGLTGIKEKNGVIVRPLCRTSREDIEAIVNDFKERFVTDSSNLTGDYTRNVIRNEILPLFQEKVNTKTVHHIEKTIRYLREADAYIKGQADEEYHKYVKFQEGVVQMDVEAFALPNLLLQEILYRAVIELSGCKKDIASIHIKQIVELFRKENGKSVDLPYHLRAWKSYGKIVIGKKKRGESLSFRLPKVLFEVEEIGPIVRVEAEENGLLLTLSDGEEKKLEQNSCIRWFDYDRITDNLLVRTRKPGDFITISEDGKRKKLKSYFMDEKIPREERETIPLVAAGNEIFWIIGKRNSESARITKKTKTILKMRLCDMEEDSK